MKKIIIAAGILALFLVSGCVGQPPADGEAKPGLFGNLFKKAESINKPFVTGTEALKFFFEENAPPESSLSSESFPLIVVAENRGAVKVPANELMLTLGSPTLWSFDKTATWHNAADIEPRIVTVGGVALPGGKEAIELGDAKYRSTPAEKKSDYISVIACYPYQTILQSSLCAATRGGTCDPIASKTFYSSSAPVQVTEYKQISARKDTKTGHFNLSFSFKIKNSGDGTSYTTGSCLTDFGGAGGGATSDIFALEEVSYSGNKYQQQQLKCSRALHGLPATKDGTEVTCTLNDVNVAPNSNEPLVIKFNYVYKESFKTSIDIIPAK